jgi:hypothetical protein
MYRLLITTYGKGGYAVSSTIAEFQNVHDVQRVKDELHAANDTYKRLTDGSNDIYGYVTL